MSNIICSRQQIYYILYFLESAWITEQSYAKNKSTGSHPWNMCMTEDWHQWKDSALIAYYFLLFTKIFRISFKMFVLKIILGVYRQTCLNYSTDCFKCHDLLTYEYYQFCSLTIISPPNKLKNTGNNLQILKILDNFSIRHNKICNRTK